MNKYEGIGISAIKYAVLNLILIFNNLLLLASGPYGGGTGGFFNDLGVKVLNLNADFLIYLIYFFILFAVCFLPI
ncbi:hypothetical protein PGRAT_19510 [Paenibacillus graminis]|uniref:Uncharacterized protein n=1 Tax=Paenibacillus graminis TaxID=189425 RepID=A0A089NKH8_9BACL|nr:hypothetical protein PGRAT_19510 [Paenibacillus graminis]